MLEEKIDRLIQQNERIISLLEKVVAGPSLNVRIDDRSIGIPTVSHPVGNPNDIKYVTTTTHTDGDKLVRAIEMLVEHM